jgi:hypothetical protein
MTTNIYNHKKKEIAIDSRATSDGNILSDEYNKVKISGERVYFCAGNLSDIERLIKILEEHDNGDNVAIGSEIKANIIFAENGSAYMSAIDSIGDFWINKLECNNGSGSGSLWALAGLDHGLTSRQAVKYASRKDAFTGGKIQVFNVTKHKFN